MLIGDTQGVPLTQLKEFGRVLAKRMGGLALAWVVIYFCTRWMADGIPSLFAPAVGALAGIVFGWVMAQDAVEEAGFTGLALWVILVLAAWLAIWIPQGLMGAITRWGIGGFGGWMLIMFAMICSMAAAVWRASIDD